MEGFWSGKMGDFPWKKVWWSRFRPKLPSFDFDHLLQKEGRAHAGVAYAKELKILLIICFFAVLLLLSFDLFFVCGWGLHGDARTLKDLLKGIWWEVCEDEWEVLRGQTLCVYCVTKREEFLVKKGRVILSREGRSWQLWSLNVP